MKKCNILIHLYILLIHSYLGMKNGPVACMEFIMEQGHFIVANNLERNMILHFCNMSDFG